MKIVITNPSCLTNAHIATLRTLGEVTKYADTTNETIAKRLHDADIAVIDCILTPVTAELLTQCPKLRYFSLNTIGYDGVDVDAVKNAGVVASNVPGFCDRAVAELALGLMLSVNRKICQGNVDVRNELTAVDPGTPEAVRYEGFNLKGKTLGIIGLGNIGTQMAELGNGVGMRVIGYNRTAKQVPNVELVLLADVMARSDVIVLCLALNEQTKGIINSDLIAGMKPTAVFINIARADLVDHGALAQALNDGSIGGAGIDAGSEHYVGVKNTVLTPHIGHDTAESNDNLGQTIVDNIAAFVAGSPINWIA